MRFLYLIAFCCVAFTNLTAEETQTKKSTICLNMIVKNETKVIKRCLASVKPIIDYWVIVDTGSSDGTQAMVKEFMQDIPGELHERPWKNFEHNRNEALELAKGKADYVMFIDADDKLEYDPDFKLPLLSLDYYNSVIYLNGLGGLQYDRPLLVKDTLDWKWYGVLHEYLHSPSARTFAKLEGLRKMASTEGARSRDPLKYQKDAQVLEAALKEDPTNARYVFYLAQSYKHAGDYASALKNYEKSITMASWDQEIFYAKLQVAQVQELLNFSPEKVIKSYYEAYHYRPTRAEPLFYLAKYYRSRNDFAPAYLMASIGMTLPFPKDSLFNEKWVYDYDMALECSISAYWIGKYEECKKISEELLAKANLPASVRETVERNLAFANEKIVEKSILTMHPVRLESFFKN